MPLYEFRCPSGHDFEKFYRSISSAASEETCPECGQMAVRRMSAAGLVFKGSGFYITDYGKDGKKSQIPPETAKPKNADPGATAPAAESKTGLTESKSGSTESKPGSTESKPAATPKKTE